MSKENNHNLFEKNMEKGDLGEKIIHNYLNKKNLTVFSVQKENKPHFCDLFFMTQDDLIIAADVKTCTKMDTKASGIPRRQYLRYKKFRDTSGISFCIFFIDDESKEVHMVEIGVEEPFRINREHVAWSLDNMLYLFSITEEEKENFQKIKQENNNG